jgi:hypothetical protein
MSTFLNILLNIFVGGVVVYILGIIILLGISAGTIGQEIGNKISRR